MSKLTVRRALPGREASRGLYVLPFRERGRYVLVAVDRFQNRVSERYVLPGDVHGYESAWRDLRRTLELFDPAPPLQLVDKGTTQAPSDATRRDPPTLAKVTPAPPTLSPDLVLLRARTVLQRIEEARVRAAASDPLLQRFNQPASDLW